MASNYLSEPERIYREERKALAEQEALEITKHNEMLVGDIKTYKGIRYQKRQRGIYTCLDLPPLSGLDGDFTSTAVLHRIIDSLEREGNLPSSN